MEFEYVGVSILIGMKKYTKKSGFFEKTDASKLIKNQGLAKNGYHHEICRIFLPHFHYFPALELHGMTHSGQI